MNAVKQLPGHSNEFEFAREAVASLPPLPSIVRYLDDYSDEWRTIRTPEASEKWSVQYDTLSASLSFSAFVDQSSRALAKHFANYCLGNFSPGHTVQMITGLSKIPEKTTQHWLLEAVERIPSSWEEYWNHTLRHKLSQKEAQSAKLFLRFLCEMNIGHLSPGDYAGFSGALTFDWGKHYKGVEAGTSVISIEQEQAIIEHLDEVARHLIRGIEISDEALVKACLLSISYQHGLRPVQISRIEFKDLRIYENDAAPIVHFTAHRAKKRTSNQKTIFTRKIKQDWSPLFAEYFARRKHGPVWLTSKTVSVSKLFTLPKSKIISSIADVLEEATGERLTATNLRHSAAQRMADAGATIEEIAEFMGHSDHDTSLVYIEASPTQAETLNRAMSASPIYSKIAEIARNGTINKDELAEFPEDQQIGGMPHGISIAGIGACNLGQSLCANNPVLSCYGCRKFIPVSDTAIHQDVLESLREVVQHFFMESRGGNQSPAYRQLSSTLDAVQSVLKLLSGKEAFS